MSNLSLKWRIGLALITFSCAAILALIAEAHRENAGIIVVHLTIEVDAPRAEVWPWLTRGERAQGWVSGLLKFRGDPSSPGPVGAREFWVTSDKHMHDGEIFSALNLTRTCTEYAEPSRLSTHLSAPGEFDGDETYQLTDLGNGRTRLEVTTHFRYSGWFARLVRPLIARAAQEQMAEDIARLKMLVEKTTRSTPPIDRHIARAQSRHVLDHVFFLDTIERTTRQADVANRPNAGIARLSTTNERRFIVNSSISRNWF